MKALRVVRDRMGALGLSDPLPDDARYIRLPFGVNSQAQIRQQYGSPGAGQADGMVPDRTLNIEQAATILAGPDWQTVADTERFRWPRRWRAP